MLPYKLNSVSQDTIVSCERHQDNVHQLFEMSILPMPLIQVLLSMCTKTMKHIHWYLVLVAAQTKSYKQYI